MRFGLCLASDHGVSCAPPSSAGSLRQSAAWHFFLMWKKWWKNLRQSLSHEIFIWKMWREICNKTNLDAKFYIQTSRKVDFYPRLYRILPNPWQPPLGRYYSSELWSTGCYNVLQQIHKSCSIVWTVCCSLMQIGGEMLKDLETWRLWGLLL